MNTKEFFGKFCSKFLIGNLLAMFLVVIALMFGMVFRRHYDGMFRLTLRMLGDEAESKDVVSDVFAQLLHSDTDLRSDTLQAYLLTSVRNRCINLLVHKQKEQQMQKAVVVEMITPEQTAEQEQLQMLYHYIDTHCWCW